ncbi:MAG: bacterioferritin [Pseudomonadota bacterium]
MKGSQRVIEQLAKLLSGELAARDQYFAHARHYADWGLTKLYEHTKHEMEHETQHADELIARLLFLEADVDLSKQDPLNVGDDVPSMLKNDLDLEYQVVGDLRAAMAICEEERDYVSRDMLLKMLDDTEVDHAHWLEQQLGLIKRVGLPNYLQSQM